MENQRVLVTGLSGFLGRALSQEKPSDLDLIGSTRTISDHLPHRETSEWVECDLEDSAEVDACLEMVSPVAVVHAAGEANVDSVQQDPLAGIGSNAVATANLATSCARRDIHLVYVSSNAVFSGDEAPYSETSGTTPVNSYGLIKLVSERLALNINPRTTIARPILMYGWNDEGGRSNPALFTIDRLRAGQTVQTCNALWRASPWRY